MKLTVRLVLLAVAGALFVLAALRIGIPALDFVALGLAFLTASMVAEHIGR